MGRNKMNMWSIAQYILALLSENFRERAAELVLERAQAFTWATVALNVDDK
jgi:hypothetical protein